MAIPIRASNPIGFTNTSDLIGFTDLRKKTFDWYFVSVSEIRPKFLIQKM
ncbi:uncharacterized protein G2W53_041236 [Senna tora]|uniref:Uncharacterized protein n=1 Tax=Senna tora TaxID=362788 RepID=A0A834SGS4_9FABA|nr:uncharacterized protein G2W53_041236 [Senna tora]